MRNVDAMMVGEKSIYIFTKKSSNFAFFSRGVSKRKIEHFFPDFLQIDVSYMSKPSNILKYIIQGLNSPCCFRRDNNSKRLTNTVNLYSVAFKKRERISLTSISLTILIVCNFPAASSSMHISQPPNTLFAYV